MLFLVFFFGLLVGSFLNVCIYRIPRNESIVFPGSHCTVCGAPLRFFDLIPVVSYLLLGGRCRYCRCTISPRYPLVELTTAMLITLQGWRRGITASFFLYAALTAVLVAVAIIDFDHQIIPDGLVLAIAMLGLAQLIVVLLPQLGPAVLLERTAGFLLGGGLFFLISVISRGGMGGGDVKLAAVLGLWFGWKQLLLLMFLAFVSGAFVSVVLLLAHIKDRKEGVPFGPFLAAAAYLVSLFGSELVHWYLQTFFIG
ncbi:MAG: prepilin peptidase [Oscillospiraceae bacterium]|jgi:leader peptidase (prepilin peptidase)/N-methyltransferase|nr:prepilin peptidase [Oscillospiraceae bacterium]